MRFVGASGRALTSTPTTAAPARSRAWRRADGVSFEAACGLTDRAALAAGFGAVALETGRGGEAALGGRAGGAAEAAVGTAIAQAISSAAMPGRNRSQCRHRSVLEDDLGSVGVSQVFTPSPRRDMPALRSGA
jgi:hypothetical protein